MHCETYDGETENTRPDKNGQRKNRLNYHVELPSLYKNIDTGWRFGLVVTRWLRST